MFEAALRDLFASQITTLEEGLTVLNTEQYIPNAIGTRSFIDILAKDARGRWVLTERKRSDAASREAIHEIYKYVEAVKGHLGARTAGGQTIEGELKTTTPYQPGFGAKQKETIAKDLARLAASTADHRIMFVTDPDTFAALCKPAWAARAQGVEIVDLVTGRSFTCPGSPLRADQN